ncbi:MAG: hypothetical protein ACYCZF_06295 [Anaerolineae bacterium]
MSSLAYKANCDAVIERLRAFAERRTPDRIYATFGVPYTSQTLASFRSLYSEGECVYPDPGERIAFWDSLLAERPQVEDDSLPMAYLTEMDQGLYGGVLGGDVRFVCNTQTGWISSMVPRLLCDWSEFEHLHFDPNHIWFQHYLKQLQVFQQGAEKKFGIASLVCCDGVNFIFELLGATEAYMSLIDKPEMAQRALELAYQVAGAIQDAFFTQIPLFQGGTFSLNFGWLPGRVVMESVDPFHMTSVAYFEAWGREPLERMLSRFDGGELHLHGNGRHLLEAVSTVKGMKAIILGEDAGYPPAFTILRALRARAGDMPLGVDVGYDDFSTGLREHSLPGGVLYHVYGAPSVSEANRTMDQVRNYCS